MLPEIHLVTYKGNYCIMYCSSLYIVSYSTFISLLRGEYSGNEVLNAILNYNTSII
jgi:hypothetical protein